ncbi:hypothetical protein Landi51_08602 [Colletotrichum acutatum]
MCLAENIYHIACGCWQGHHISHPCHKQRYTPRSPNDSLGGDDVCPDLSCSGVFRQPGKCLVCRRREAQQRSVFPLPLPPLTPPPSPPSQPSYARTTRRGNGEDEDDDESSRRVRIALLAEVLRRAVVIRGGEGDGSHSASFRSRSNTASDSRFIVGSNDFCDFDEPGMPDTADGETYLIKASEQTFETKSTAWHQH